MAFPSWKKHKPKGQQPVNVKELEKHKKWHYDYIMKDRNPNAYIRNRFSNEYRDKIKNVDDIWKYLTINASRDLDHYHQYLTQAERNLINMIPCGRRYEIMGRHFSLVGHSTNNEDTIILEKQDKRRRNYFTKEEWQDMMDLLVFLTNLDNSNITRLIFSKDINNSCMPKLYEKEKQFIIDAGCEYLGECSFKIIEKPFFSWQTEREKDMVGWEFKLPRYKNIKMEKVYESKLV